MKRPSLKQALLVAAPLLLITGTSAALLSPNDPKPQSKVEAVADPVDQTSAEDQNNTPELEGASPSSEQTTPTTSTPSTGSPASTPSGGATQTEPAPAPAPVTLVSERFEYRINGNNEDGYCIKSYSDGSTTEKWVGSRPYPQGKVKVDLTC